MIGLSGDRGKRSTMNSELDCGLMWPTLDPHQIRTICVLVTSCVWVWSMCVSAVALGSLSE